MLHLQHVHHRDVCACVCPVPSRCVLLRTPVPPDSQAYGQTRTWTCSVSHKLRRLGWRLHVRHAKAVHGLTGAVHLTTGAPDAQVTAGANALYSDTGASALWLTTSGIRTNDTLFDVTKRIQSEDATPLKVFANIHFQTTTRLYVIYCSKNVNSAGLDARHFAENNDSKRHIWPHQARATLAACDSVEVLISWPTLGCVTLPKCSQPHRPEGLRRRRRHRHTRRPKAAPLRQNDDKAPSRSCARLQWQSSKSVREQTKIPCRSPALVFLGRSVSNELHTQEDVDSSTCSQSSSSGLLN